MPNIISKIKTPDNSVYDIKPTTNANINTDGVFYITSANGSSSSAITASLNDLTSYYEGLKVVLYYNLANTSSTTPTLNINSLGAKTIRRTSSTDLEEGLKSGGMYHLVYDGRYFVLDGYTNTILSNNSTNNINPVAGTASGLSSLENIKAGEAISNAGLVYYDSSLDGIASITRTNKVVYQAWGLAYYDGTAYPVAAGDIINPNRLLQNAQITVDTTGKSTDKIYKHAMPLYAMFDSNFNLIPAEVEYLDKTLYPAPFNAQCGRVAATSTSIKHFIYVGTWAAKATANSGYVVNIDLSNHDFITLSADTGITTVPSSFNTVGADGAVISHINGIPVGNTSGSGSGGGGAKVTYGICDSYDMGGVSPRSGSGDGSERGSTSGSGPFTLIATTIDRNYTPGESLVSLYLTGIDMYSGAYLQIDGNTSYPIYYKDHAITRSELESESVATFVFNSSTYYLIAGAKGGDYELTSNKVLRIDSSSTNSQYPSAKCIYNIVGDIEAALQAI